jgi:hypothetical protein
MKKSSLFLLIVNCYLLLVGVTYAATPSATDNQIKDQLIENIASRVAELKLVEKRGIIGVVTDVSNTQITISDVQDKTRFIDVDELTKFSSPSAKGSLGISDITKGTSIGALGLYNKESRRLLARFVNAITLPKFIYAKVDSIDSKNIMLNTTTEDKKSLIVDIQTSTRISLHNKSAGITRSTFSKISNADDIIAIGFSIASNENMMAASRIIVLTDFRPIETTVPSTRSAEKKTP